MSTNGENGDTDAAEGGGADTPTPDRNTQTPGFSSENELPRIQDDPGSADEWFARGILATPFVLLLLFVVGGVIVVWTGSVSLNVEISGTVSPRYLLNTFVRPLVFGIGVLLAGVYVLAAAKEWGIRPVKWLASAARNHRPPELERDLQREQEREESRNEP